MKWDTIFEMENETNSQPKAHCRCGADSVMCAGAAITERFVDHCLNNSRQPLLK